MGRLAFFTARLVPSDKLGLSCVHSNSYSNRREERWWKNYSNPPPYAIMSDGQGIFALWKTGLRFQLNWRLAREAKSASRLFVRSFVAIKTAGLLFWGAWNRDQIFVTHKKGRLMQRGPGFSFYYYSRVCVRVQNVLLFFVGQSHRDKKRSTREIYAWNWIKEEQKDDQQKTAPNLQQFSEKK